MAIGNWGKDVVFCVSDKSVFTFRDMKRSIGSSWATHSRIGGKDQVEFLRPNLQKLTFTIELNALHGVPPRRTLEMLEEHAEAGDVYPFVVGGKKIGRYQWRITDLSEAWEIVMNQGELVKAKVDVTMEEYV